MFKPAAFLVVTLLLCANASFAQRDDQISLWADEDRTYCGITTAPGIVSVYMFHTSSEPATAVQFSAPKPECWGGATWMGDVIAGGFLSIGNSQSDLSIAYVGPSTGCIQPPVYLGRIDYFTSGTTTPCCDYRAAPAQTSPPAIWVADCQYHLQEISAGSGVTINPNSFCPCDVGPPPPNDPTIALFADQGRTTCALIDDTAAVRSVYVFHTGATSATASRFAARLPACWTGATWLADHVEQPFLSLGTSQTDLSVVYTGCVEPPIFIGRIDYLASGSSPNCCEYTATAVAGEIGILVADCDYESRAFPAGPGVMINPFGECPCGESPVSIRETTWGRIKAMYSDH